MEGSFIFKLVQSYSLKETNIPSTSHTIENPQPQFQQNESTILVRFGGDEASRKYDPAYLKYTFREVICENEEEEKVVASHCLQENAGFFREIGDKQQELKCYEMLLKSAPKDLPFLTKAAEINYELGRLDCAINCYKSINVLYPAHAQAFYNLAVSLRRMHRWGQAKAVLQRYLLLENDDPEGYKDMAQVLLELHEKAQAIRMLQKCIEITPKDSEALNTLGNLHFSSEPELAIDYYLRGVTANPLNPYNFNGLGVVYNSMHQYERAVVEFLRAISIEPADPDFHYNIALAYKGLKNVESAERSFKVSLQANPSYYLAYEGLGNLCLESAQYPQAISYYQLAVQSCPDFANALYNLGIAYQKSGNLPKAAQYLQRYINLNATDFDVYHRLAEIYTQIKCKERMAREQEKEMPKPSKPLAKTVLGKCIRK